MIRRTFVTTFTTAFSCQRLSSQAPVDRAHGRGLLAPAGASEALRAQAPQDEALRREIQEEFLKLRFGMFLHFGMGTFTGREWAHGYEDPALFNPAKLDCRQWAGAAAAAGMKYAVLTAKHTGAWCLWDSAHTTHDISAFTNYKRGKGDIVREFVDAFRARGIKVGLYYCFPGNFSSSASWSAPLPPGKPDLHGLPPEAQGDYAGFIKKQLTELLSRYGPIQLLWIDQYSNRYTVKQWPEIFAHIKSIQPRCLILANNAPSLEVSDVLSFEFPWKPDRLPPEGNTIASEISDTIQKSWFWRPVEPLDLKPAAEIVKMLKLANSRRANYLLNVPPDMSGLISPVHVERLRAAGSLLGVKQ